MVVRTCQVRLPLEGCKTSLLIAHYRQQRALTCAQSGGTRMRKCMKVRIMWVYVEDKWVIIIDQSALIKAASRAWFQKNENASRQGSM